MDLNNIKKFIELAKEEGVSELKYEAKDIKISVNFNTAQSSSQVITAPVPIQMATQAQPAKVESSGSGYHEIKSPFVGTYYEASSPDKDAFVKVGDKVGKGTTLCILEAMKIMNEIESDISGEIVEICVENESLVEYGQTLFKIRA